MTSVSPKGVCACAFVTDVNEEGAVQNPLRRRNNHFAAKLHASKSFLQDLIQAHPKLCICIVHFEGENQFRNETPVPVSHKTKRSQR